VNLWRQTCNLVETIIRLVLIHPLFLYFYLPKSKTDIMRTKGLILFLAAAFLLPFNAEAQLGSKLKKKLEETVNKALVKEGEEDATEQDSATEQEGRQMDLSKLGIGKVTASYDENYDFRGMMRMKTDIYDKGKHQGTTDADVWFDAGKGNLGMESMTMTDDDGKSMSAVAIVDSRNKVMITWAVIEGGKTGMIMPIPDSLVAETGDEDAEKEDAVKIRKTGGTKTICGYRCEEYEVTEDDGKLVSNVWAADDLKLPGSRKLMGSQQGMPRSYGQGKIKGAILASETYEKGKLTTKSEVTKVDLNAEHSISVAGVSLIQMEMGRWGQKKK